MKHRKPPEYEDKEGIVRDKETAKRGVSYTKGTLRVRFKLAQVCLIGLMWVWIAPSTSYAQETYLEEVFQEAMTAYNAGNWPKAATGFMKAYNLQPEAVFLYNAARARERQASGDPELLKSALALFRKAIAQVERPLNGATLAKAKASEARIVAELERMERAAQAALEAKRARGQLSWVGWSGGGVVLAGASLWGVTIAQHAGLRDENQLLAEEQDRARYDAQRAQFVSAQRQARTQLVVAWSAMAFGASIIAWDLATRGRLPWERMEASVAISLGGGVVIHGRF